MWSSAESRSISRLFSSMSSRSARMNQAPGSVLALSVPDHDPVRTPEMNTGDAAPDAVPLAITTVFMRPPSART